MQQSLMDPCQSMGSYTSENGVPIYRMLKEMFIHTHICIYIYIIYIYIYIYIYQMDCVCQRYHKECSTRTCADDCYNCWKKPKLKFYGFQCNSSAVCESLKGFFCDLQTAWRLVLSMKPWSYIWLEFGLFSTIIYIYIYIYIHIYIHIYTYITSWLRVMDKCHFIG